jgi:membrane-associated phospholipid phosphatase
MSQKKQFSVKFKMFQHDEVIIFASTMAQSRFFLTSFLLLLSGWVAVGLGLNYSASNWIHHFCNHTIDNFFIHFSWLAEWLLIVLAILTGFYFNPKRGLVFGIGLGIQSIFVAFVKTWFNAPRPIEAKFFPLRHIQNLEIHHWQSFPSGHTAVAFFCMGLFAISIKNLQNSTAWGITCALFAAGIGYSRIYLGQHFLFDVCVGGTIAILFLQLSYQYSKKLGYDV